MTYASAGLDLHDLQELRSRSTRFLQDLLKLLRSMGVRWSAHI